MSRISDGAKRSALLAMLVMAALLLPACDVMDGLEGRNGNRKGNRLFQSMQFGDAASEYERALQQLGDNKPDTSEKSKYPIIHYNLGLTYSKMYRPAYDKPILIGETTEQICQDIGAAIRTRYGCKLGDPTTPAECKDVPNLKQQEAQVCVKRADAKDDSDRRRYNECGEQSDCPSSFECKKATFCATSSAELADLAARHLKIWIKAQPSDQMLDEELKKVRKQISDAQAKHEKRMEALPASDGDARAAEIQRNKAVMDELNKRVDQLTLKEDMRTMMTQAWIDTNQFGRALGFWEGELADKPQEARIPRIMGNIAGIHLKANDWRKAIEWYHKVAEAEKDEELKVAALNSIGNVAWSKLNSKSLTIDESVELSDYGIGALQAAAQLRPKLTKLHSLQAVIMQFRSTTQGASFAAAIDRSNMQDLQRLTRVLIEEAKKQQQGQTPATTPAPTTPSPPAPTPPAPASPSMSGGPAPKTGG